MRGDGTALGGLRVVDLTSTLSGATASGVLADFGAEVTLVEPPGGSPLRGQRGWPFWGRGKRSVTADLSDPNDLARVRALVRDADVLLESWRPGVAERLGVGWSELERLNPRLVYASITGFGAGNALSHVPAYEPVVMAKIGGLASFSALTARPGPAFVSTPYGVVSAGHLALQGILAALFERETSGRGQRIETSMAQAVAAHDTWNWLIYVVASRYRGGYVAQPMFDLDHMVPNSPSIVRLLVGLSADGRWMQFTQTTPRLWDAFLRVADLEWTRDDPRLEDGPDSEDLKLRAEFWELALAAVRKRTYAEWTAVFDQEPHVWAEVFREGPELLDHPQLVADERTVRLNDPELGEVHQPGPLVVMQRTPAQLGSPAPRLGEHDGSDGNGGEHDGSEPTIHGGDVPTAAPEGHDTTSGDRGLPLAGVTIVELGTFFAAPYGATLLAEFGARVIKLEALEGDTIRHAIPFPELGGVKVLAGKESVAVDLSTDAGRAIALEVIDLADAVLCSLRAGAAERLSLGTDDLLARNPDLVVVYAPGYGTGPPCGHRPAFAPTIGAGTGIAARNLGGLARIETAPDQPMDQLKLGAMRLGAAAMAVAHADGFSALAVANALLLGLLTRKRLGVGQVIGSSMLATMAHVLSETVLDYEGAPDVAVPDPDLYGLGPRYRLYETSDGWLFLAAPEEDQWTRLADALGIDRGLGNDSSLADLLAERFAARPAAEWERDLVAVDVAAVEVAKQGIDTTIMNGPLGVALGYITADEHPVLGEHPRLVPPVRFSRSATELRPSALCGQHTDAVLAELGRTAEEIEALRTQKVVG